MTPLYEQENSGCSELDTADLAFLDLDALWQLVSYVEEVKQEAMFGPVRNLPLDEQAHILKRLLWAEQKKNKRAHFLPDTPIAIRTLSEEEVRDLDARVGRKMESIPTTISEETRRILRMRLRKGLMPIFTRIEE